MKVISSFITNEAAGLSRIVKHRNESNCVCISACRTYKDTFTKEIKEKVTAETVKPYIMTKAENLARTAKLRAALKANSQLKTIELVGSYAEEISGVAMPEFSFFVWSDNLDYNLLGEAIKLGNMFNQDSIAYAEKGKDFALYCTSNNVEGYSIGQKMATFKGTKYGTTEYTDVDELTGKEVKVLSEIFSKVRGRPFFFKNYTPV